MQVATQKLGNTSASPPSLAEAVTRTFALGAASRLRSLFNEAGLAEIESHTVKHTFVLPSFDLYYGPVERGGASIGQALAALPEEIRRAVREEVRRDLADRGRYVSLWHISAVRVINRLFRC